MLPGSQNSRRFRNGPVCRRRIKYMTLKIAFNLWFLTEVDRVIYFA